MPDLVRKTALNILNKVDKGAGRLDTLLDKTLSDHTEFTKRDRAFLHALVYGVTRWRGNLDWFINHFSKTRFEKIKPDVLNVLRLGAFQIIHMDRVPDSAAVNTSVELAKAFAPHWIVRFINGVLRNISREHANVPPPDSGSNPVQALSVQKSFPPWLVKKWLNRFGQHEAEALCDMMNTIPPITLRTNTLKTNREYLLKSLAPHVEKVIKTPIAPDGISLFNPFSLIPALESFHKGEFQVQDEAAQLVGCLVNPKPGETILDACAGRGGKTGHLAQFMRNRGKIIAIDQHSERLKQLSLEMKRLGVTIVNTLQHDLFQPLDRHRMGLFDKVLLDAPCSGLGVIRRHPDAKWQSNKKNLTEFRERQLTFLDRLAPLLKPSGSLVYAVCSMEAEETETVTDAFLSGHADFSIEKCSAAKLPDDMGSLMDAKGCFRTYPHRNGMDGFYSVCFRKATR